MPNLIDGATYLSESDQVQLINQLRAVRDIMLDGVWRTVAELHQLLPTAPEPSISAQLRNLRKPKCGGYSVRKQLRAGSTRLWEYQVSEPTVAGLRTGVSGKTRNDSRRCDALVVDTITSELLTLLRDLDAGTLTRATAIHQFSTVLLEAGMDTRSVVAITGRLVAV